MSEYIYMYKREGGWKRKR